jgi:drug/metabolite transporter superfamily protein YnfA
MLGLLVLAAALEVGGDAAIRHGLLRTSWPWLLVGALGLTAYGLVVNTDRLIAFGRLMGLYIAVFVVVSQVLSVTVFGERPSPSLLLGVLLIVVGGLVIHLGAR